MIGCHWKGQALCTTMYKRNAGFIAKLNNSSRNEILDKMKIVSSETRTTLILDRCVSLRNSLGLIEYLTFIAVDFQNFALNKAYRIKKKF